MKSSEILRRAAAFVHGDRMPFAFSAFNHCAITAGVSSNKYYKARDEYLKLVIADGDYTNWPEEIILALCLAAAIAESEGD